MNQKQQDIEFGSGTGHTRNDDPVTCLGITFENDEARRAHFTEELRQKLKDPEFRKIEGFPIGEDEDILNLSDPPYYTAPARILSLGILLSTMGSRMIWRRNIHRYHSAVKCGLQLGILYIRSTRITQKFRRMLLDTSLSTTRCRAI